MLPGRCKPSPNSRNPCLQSSAINQQASCLDRESALCRNFTKATQTNCSPTGIHSHRYCIRKCIHSTYYKISYNVVVSLYATSSYPMSFISTVYAFLDGMLTHPLWGADSCPAKANRREPLVGHRRKDGESCNDSVKSALTPTV